MSLSRPESPPPETGSEWSVAGAASSKSTGSGSSTPPSGSSGLLTPNSLGSTGVSWAAAKAKSDEIRRHQYPTLSTPRNGGFFSRTKRRFYTSLPRFRTDLPSTGGYVDKDEYGRGERYTYKSGKLCGGLLRRRRLRILMGFVMALVGFCFFWATIVDNYRRSMMGRGSKFVVILASNVEGGVMEVKGAREWAIERNSIWNKEQYTKRWGYDLEIVNMMTQRRYSHEWREGWEKIDLIRETMRKHPDAEWFWWLDLNTWIMEYSFSLQDHIFNRLDDIARREMKTKNTLKTGPPSQYAFLDKPAPKIKSEAPIDLILSQDCSGFSLGSFFIRQSDWSERLLDIWWDPVLYEQKHLEWEHKEQDALEYLYAEHPWIRDHVAFLPQRHINTYPPGACGDGNDPAVHYQKDDHDFLVNMAGCQFGRDCLGEMYQFREYSDRFNHMSQKRYVAKAKRCMHSIKDWFRRVFRRRTGEQQTVAPWPST